MKNIKKLLSIVMVLTLVLSLGASAFAATVTITDADANSTFNAYELLTATYNEDTDLYQYHLNTTFADAIAAGLTAAGVTLKGEVTTENENEVIEAISRLDEDQTRTFADAAFNSITGAGITATKTTTTKEFTDMNGYYLISETVKAGAESTVTSLVMLGTYGKETTTTITTKEDHPSSDKKVMEHNDTTGADSGWQDAADYDIGDAVPFQLSATITDAQYTAYETYYLQFVDDMSKGLGAPTTTKIYYKTAEGAEVDIKGYFTGPTEVTDPASEYEDGHVYTWTCEDIKQTGIPAGGTIYVEYTAELLEGADIGNPGNPNESHIVYSNNPYEEGTGKTPDNKVTVFTFDMDVDKVDGANDPLTGAAFTLLKEVPTPDPMPAGAVLVDYDGLKTAAAGNYYQVTTGEEGAETTTTYQVVGTSTAGEAAHFDFTGLDSGKYLLVESVVPSGFNKADDLYFEVAATYDTNSSDPKLTDLVVTPAASFTVNVDAGTFATTVTNLTGVELPSTGGIGTTIFYAVGAILVVGAVILLVTRKRMSGAEK